MKGFLAEMYPVKVNEILRAKQACAIDETGIVALSPEGSFKRALQSNQSLRIIAEVKPASPAYGQLTSSSSTSADIARLYESEAAALSVLTDEHYFKGSYDLLAGVASTSVLPVLCKDFVIDPYQVVRARAAGAAAVLLIVRILSDAELRTLSALITQYGMTAVVEIQNEQDLARAEKISADTVLINNRDLETLAIDLSTTARLAPLLNSDAVVISASGINSPSDIEVLRPFASNFLIGSALMRSEDPALLLQQLKQAGNAAAAGGKR
ncbi:MAG: indole-3-glycerol-phosphate synthase [Candidatus Obscuribacterales bacterium]|nr:indole-3-glycerol-phosphate synthase [Candidatus Obscuribacterales bacterium]